MRKRILFTLQGYPVAAYASVIDEIQESPALLLPPFSPKQLAGLIKLNNRAVALAHLAVCCGLQILT